MLSIITPTLNRLDLVQQMYGALQKATKVPYELLLVDNGSDGTGEWATGQGITVIKPPEPLTFAASNNLAVKQAKGDTLLLLNNDTIPEQGFLETMLGCLDKAHIVGAKLVYPNRLIQHAGVAFTADGLAYHLWRYASEFEPMACRDMFVPMITGACMLMRKGLYEALGGFDEGYVNGWEDTDFCLRAKEKGATILYCARATLVHLEGQTGHQDTNLPNAKRFDEQWLETNRLYEVLGMWNLRLRGGTIA